VAQRTAGDITFEIRHRSGVSAQAVEEDGEFIVLEGSQALKDTGYVQQSYTGLKDNLVKQGVLQVQSETLYVFVKPYSFRSPSAAAAVVLDRNSNGLTEWKVKGDKRTYHDVKQARLAGGGSGA
jgi:hypothetical protein